MILLAKFIVFTFVAFLSPQIFRGIKVRGVGAAATVAIVFGLLNLLIGWLLALLIGLLGFPLTVLTLGLFLLVIPTLVNAILLKITDWILDSFDIQGWWPAFGMGFLFALGGWIVGRLTS
jgi:putative membrane protein